MFARRIWISLCLGLLAFGTAVAGEKVTALNIEAQSVRTALQLFGAQTGLQVSMRLSGKAIDDVRVSALEGKFTVTEGLARLLANTGLTYEFVNERTVAIRPVDRQSTGNGGAAGQMRLAMVAEEGTRQGAGTMGAGERADVVVEGQRGRPAPFSTANLDLTRTEDDALPFLVFDAKDIQLSGASNLQEFFQNRLPQNFTDSIHSELDGAASGFNNRTAQVNLRGWGNVETVFLLDGRRMPAHYQQLSGDTANATPNLRGIPVGSIERIEILSSAGSAIYGVGATGGVINIITRREFRGGQVAVNYETPSDAHAPRRGVDLTYGLPLAWGLSLRLGASYSDSEPLLAGDRANVSIARWRRLAMERDPAQLINRMSGDPFMTSSGVYGATPNIQAFPITGNLFAALPGAQASNFTTVPTGATGSSPLSAYQPGVYNLDLAEGADGNQLFARGSPLGTKDSSHVLSLGVGKDLGGEWHWSLDARYTETGSEGAVYGELTFVSSWPFGQNPFVPAEAPTNPFNQPVQVRMLDPNMDRPELRARPRNESWDLSTTLRGAIGQWRGFLDVSYAHNQNRNALNRFWEPEGGWTAAFLSGAYNPFVDPRVTAPAAPDFYERYTAYRGFSASATRTYQSALKISGPLLDLPAGVVQLTAGVDGSRTDRYRSESFQQYQDGLTGQPRVPLGETSDISSPLSGNPYIRFAFDTYAGYTEATAPLLSAAQGVPLVQRLELFGSARLDRMVRNGFRSQSMADEQAGLPPEPLKYTTTSRISAFGLRYEPVEGVTFRATQSTGLKPPSISQITPAARPPTSTITGLNDPVRNEGVTLLPTMYITGGNPDLLPETTESTNFGLILMSRRVPGLRVSVDYLESVRDDAIFSLAAQEAINLEPELPGIVQRGAPDGHPSGAGPITFIDQRSINFRQIASRSVDFSVEQQLQNVGGGRLVFTAAATRNLSFKVQTTNTGPAVEQVRNPAGAFSRQIAWNGNAQIRWEGPRWSAGWSAQYFDYILVPQPTSNPTQWFLLQGGDRAPRALNHDLNVSYRAPAIPNSRGLQGLLSGTSFTFGVKNVFDRAPRFWAPGTNRGIAPYDSIMGRSLWMQMSRDFGQ